MLILGERYVVDDKGRRVGVLLDLADYQRLLEAAGQPRPTEPPANGDDQPPGEADVEAVLSIIGIADKLGTPEPPLIEGKPVSEYVDLYLYGAGAQRSLREPGVRYRAERPKRKSAAKGKRRKT